MATQVAEEATCTNENCDGDHKIFDRQLVQEGATRSIMCLGCGERTTVLVTEAGISHDDSVTYKDASWNEGDE